MPLRGAASPGRVRLLTRYTAQPLPARSRFLLSGAKAREGPVGWPAFAQPLRTGSAWQTPTFVAFPPLHVGRPGPAAEAVAARKKRPAQRRAVGAQARQDALKTTRAQVYYPATPKDSASVPVWRLHPSHGVLVEVPSRYLPKLLIS